MDVAGTNERLVLDHAVPWRSQVRWRSAAEVLFEEGNPSSDQWPKVVALNVTSGAVRTVFQATSNLPGWQYAASRDEILYLSDVKPGESRRAADLASVGYVGLAPSAPRTLQAHPLGGGPDRQVATIGSMIAAFAVLDAPFVLTPDGAAVAFLRYAQPPGLEGKPIAELASMKIPANIVLLPLDGGPERVLFTYQNAVLRPHVGPFAFSPDGKFLLFGGAGGRPRMLDVTTGKDWPLIDPPNAPAWTGGGSWSADGSFLVFAVTASRTEWKLLEGLTTDGVANAMAGRGR
jgi:hypothetical protein